MGIGAILVVIGIVLAVTDRLVLGLILIILGLLSLLIVFTEGSALAPFIYALF